MTPCPGRNSPFRARNRLSRTIWARDSTQDVQVFPAVGNLGQHGAALQQVGARPLPAERVLVDEPLYGFVPDAGVVRLEDKVVLVGEVEESGLDAVTLEV